MRLLSSLFPSFAEKSKFKREQIMNTFEEVLIEKDQIIELEGELPNYMWLVLRGELSVFKWLESLFDEQGRPVDLRNLKLFSDPLHAGHQNFGARVGVFKSISLVCEDAVMFQQPLIYSLKTKS